MLVNFLDSSHLGAVAPPVQQICETSVTRYGCVLFKLMSEKSVNEIMFYILLKDQSCCIFMRTKWSKQLCSGWAHGYM